MADQPPPEPPQVWTKELMSIEEFVSLTHAWTRYWARTPHQYVPCKDCKICYQCNECAGGESLDVHIQGKE